MSLEQDLASVDVLMADKEWRKAITLADTLRHKYAKKYLIPQILVDSIRLCYHQLGETPPADLPNYRLGL